MGLYRLKAQRRSFNFSSGIHDFWALLPSVIIERRYILVPPQSLFALGIVCPATSQLTMVPVLQVLHRLKQKQNYLTRKVSLHPSPPQPQPQPLVKIVSSVQAYSQFLMITAPFSFINDENGNHSQ